MPQPRPDPHCYIAAYLAKQSSYQVLAIGKKTAPGLDGVKLIRYDLHREPSKQAHHYVRPLEAGVLHGQAVARVLQQPNDYQSIRQAACEQAHLLYSHKYGLATYLRLIRQ